MPIDKEGYGVFTSPRVSRWGCTQLKLKYELPEANVMNCQKLCIQETL